MSRDEIIAELKELNIDGFSEAWASQFRTEDLEDMLNQIKGH